MKIAVDLDGTLAHYTHFTGPKDIGEPVERMLRHVQSWLNSGHEVVVFTARVSHPKDGEECREAIGDWTELHVGQRLEVTCIKDYTIDLFFDDRCVTVENNTGRWLTGVPEHIYDHHAIREMNK